MSHTLLFMKSPDSDLDPDWWRAYVRPRPGQKGTPSLYAQTLCEALPRWSGSLLDLGCGSGIIGIQALLEKRTCKVAFADVSSEWLEECKINVRTHIAAGAIPESAVSYRWGGFEDMTAGEASQFDWILFNPPQLPTYYVTEAYKDRLAAADEKLFRFGGYDGLEKVRAFTDWYGHLDFDTFARRPNVLLLLSSFPGRSRIHQIIEEGGLSAVAVHEKRVPLRDGLVGAALRFDEDELRDRGLQMEGGNSGLTQWSKLLTVYQVSVTQKVHCRQFHSEPASEHVFV